MFFSNSIVRCIINWMHRCQETNFSLLGMVLFRLGMVARLYGQWVCLWLWNLHLCSMEMVNPAKILVVLKLRLGIISTMALSIINFHTLVMSYPSVVSNDLQMCPPCSFTFLLSISFLPLNGISNPASWWNSVIFRLLQTSLQLWNSNFSVVIMHPKQTSRLHPDYCKRSLYDMKMPWRHPRSDI